MGASMHPIATLGPGNLGNIGGTTVPSGTGDVVVENIDVPDHCVGLVIGRGGEQISQIQSQTGCRVQMSPESDGNNLRQCTLQGSRVSVDRAKAMIQDVINRAGNRPPPNRPHFDGMGVGGGRQVTHEILVPGAKCGLVIGKGGETIKNIQEQTGVKMVMIQENQESGGQPKPLRIIGDPEKVENARRMVEEIISSREDHPPGQQRFGFPGPFGMGGGQRSIGEVIVPRASVGMIIGKGGETIKRLAAESGAKIQFKPDEDQTTPDRCAVIQGTTEQIAKATQMISELVNKSGAGSGAEMFYMHVPSNKTGLVIGKGGETIKQICAESGAHVELSRDPPPNASEKVFIIKGTPYQIHHAQHIIRIKVGDISPGTPVPQFTGPGAPGAGDAYAMAHAAVPGAPQGYGNGTAQFGATAVGAPGAGQWNTAFGHQQPDPTQAAWAQQYYTQQAQPQAAYQPGAYPTQFQQPAVQPQPQPAQTTAAPSVNPQTGQPDYSAQWMEYYRSMGMHEQAALIENQIKQQGAPAAAAAAVVQPARAQQPMQTYSAYGAQPVNAAQSQFSYGAPQAQPQTGYQFPQQY